MPLHPGGWQPDWAECLELARAASAHYSLTEKEQALLYELAMQIGKEPLIVELGVCNGKTAIILAYVAKALRGTYVGIDNWSLEGSLDSVTKLFSRTVDFIPTEGQTILLQSNTHTAELPSQPIDLLLIDAGHDEANVAVDCSRWIPCVRPGGLVVFDDYDGAPLSQFESPHWAVRKYADLHTLNWPMVAFYNKVMVRRRPR